MQMIVNRKNQHLDLAADDRSQSQTSSDYDRVNFVHNALPELSLDTINSRCEMWGAEFSIPCMIGAMSGGTGRGDVMNEALVQAAEKVKIPFALGSQRASIESDTSQKRLRQLGPNAFIIGNLGGAQIIGQKGLDLARRAVDDVEANALMIHLNPLQEAMQPEGNIDWRGVSDSLESLVEQLDIPIIIKEVGAGLSVSVIKRLYNLGIRSVETAGIGGTNWTRIEALRHQYEDNPLNCYLEWGVRTVDTLIELRQCRHELPTLNVVASGGIRHGLDCARALWLGADMCAMAQPFLLAALDKEMDDAIDAVATLVSDTKKQLELAMFLTGCADLETFREQAEVVIK